MRISSGSESYFMNELEQLCAVARRENNPKRQFLVLNTKQGKHLPAKPCHALGQFLALADTLRPLVQPSRTLFIGFAETATAIGATVAIALDGYYLQTTRETQPETTYLYFTEAHSHATEQKLAKADLDAILPQVDRVVFVEDELTTGNTIMNLVTLLRKTYPLPLRFSVACLISGMTPSALQRFQQEQVSVHPLFSTSYADFTARALSYPNDGAYLIGCADAVGAVPIYDVPAYQDARRLVHGHTYHRACQQLWQAVRALSLPIHGRVLVLGTEEFMYPALFVAHQLEQAGQAVQFHATTRSPMVASCHADSPIKIRHALKSLYDDQRNTFLYQLRAYDTVLVLTDAPDGAYGLRTLHAALSQQGNHTIHVIRWCADEKFL